MSTDLTGGKEREDRKGRPLSIGKSLANIAKNNTLEFLASHLMGWMESNGIVVPDPSVNSFFDPTCDVKGAIAQMLNARLLLGALVDADCMETMRQEEEYKGGGEPRVPRLDDHVQLQPRRTLNAILRHINDEVRKKAKGQKVNQDILDARDALLDICLKKGASFPIGNYTLTAPTGIGKTLAMVAFALAMAENQGLERIIISVPYLSILYQSAKVLKEIFENEFGIGYVVEHHSLAGEREAADISETRSWNAPLVITTNVQLLESLFSANGGKLRKIHRMVNSVILFDEVQSFPYGLLVPTIVSLSHLVNGYKRTTIVTATATPPFFDLLKKDVADLGGEWNSTEIVPDGLFDKIPRRFTTTYRGKLSMPDLVEELSLRPQVMCIVNIKNHAAAIYIEMLGRRKADTFYLTTNLPPVARKAVLDEVRERLESGKPVVLITTQSVEAGVDIDFPSVFRALAPFVSLIQAGGRCNRGGRMKYGEFVVFDPGWETDPEKIYPDKDYQVGADIARTLLGLVGSKPDILEESLVRKYFSELYLYRKPIDDPRHGRLMFGRAGKNGGIFSKREGVLVPFMDFVEVAHNYRVIDNIEINILVPHPGTNFNALFDEVKTYGVTEAWSMKAKNISVSRKLPQNGSPLSRVIRALKFKDDNGVMQVSKEWFAYDERVDAYDPALGVKQVGYVKK